MALLPAGDLLSRDSRTMRWAVLVGAAAMVLIGVVLMLLLTVATNNRQLYEQHYGNLFAINLAMAALLLLVILFIAVRLLVRLRRKRFGSRLLVKLAAVFALVGFVPGMLIYTVSYQFVSRSIESWFDVRVEGALDAGLTLGRSTLDTLSLDLSSRARAAAGQLGDVSNATAGLALERLREQYAANEAVLWGMAGVPIASAGESRYLLNPARPSPQQMRNARSQRVIAWVDGLEESGDNPSRGARVRALALVPSSSVGLTSEPRFLQLSQELPPTLVGNLVAVATAHREYQERALARDGLRRMYIGTLTLSLFLAVFGAVLLAVLLGTQIARPLLVLAAGVREVASGDLSPKLALQSRDELGDLTRSFAQMTQQLADARATVEKSMSQVSAARANLQTILDNLTAGVLVLDAQGRLQSSNPGATRILRLPLAAHQGVLLAEVPGLERFAQAVQQQFEEFFREGQEHGLDHWQQSFELGEASPSNPALASTRGDTITLVARGAQMPGNTRLVVFDDISEIVSAQRAQAWGEVARRLAHEIKNPLTPIQLSAERLEMKLEGKLPEPDQAVLHKSVKTIVEQVDAMKRLVNEFRDYARLPAAELKPVDLNALIHDVLGLYGGSRSRRDADIAAQAADVPVHSELDPACPAILGDAQQLRQVIHNLLQNAQDACEGVPDAGVSIRTRYNPMSGRVRMSVVDQGSGFPEHILKRAFEPYVTTKVRGTGLGLAVVKKIADEHGARIDLSNRVDDGHVVGAQVSLSFAAASAQH